MYKIYSDNPDMVVRDDGASIAIGEQFAGRFGNPDYIAYMAWLDSGNKPEYIERIVDVWKAVKEERNRRLSACDWTQLADVDLSDEDKEAWRVYRQALRDLPQTFTTPNEVVFPTLEK